MKKTLLVIAIMLASTCGFAQRVDTKHIATNDAQANQVKPIMARPVATNKSNVKSIVKAYPSDAQLLCDFSNAADYTIGTGVGHGNVNAAKTKWQIETFPADSFQTSTFGNSFFGLPTNFQRYIVGEAQMSTAKNGVAYIICQDLIAESQNTLPINTYIQLNNPIYTYGMAGVDIYFHWYVYKWNLDKYYIDWSHDVNFTTYDSIEFYVIGVDADVSDQEGGEYYVNIPAFGRATSASEAVSNGLISEDPSEPTYIRIRYQAPASGGQNSQGVLFMIDDISYAEAPAERMQLNSFAWNNAYTRIPSVVSQADTIWFQATVTNTGSEVMTDVTLRNEMYNDTIQNASTLAGQSVSDPILLGNVMYFDTAFNTNGSFDQEDVSYQRYITLGAASEQQKVSNGSIWYPMVSKMYFTVDGQTYDTTITSYGYRVSDPIEWSNADNRYSWARDCGTTGLGRMARIGYEVNPMGGFYYGNYGYDQAGYRLCLAYDAVAYNGDVYAKGVQVVPAVNGVYNGRSYNPVSAGAAIRSSLLMFDKQAATVDDAIIPVTVEGEELESATYLVQNHDMNTDMNCDEYGRLNDFVSIYLPFTNGGYKLVGDRQYYACYQLAANGNFSVAEEYPYINIYGSGYASPSDNGYYNYIVYTPTLSSEMQNAWGRPVFSAYVGGAPFIRLVVGTDATNDAALNDVATTAADMNLYPNPAVDNTVLTYTLANSGNVVINVTDLMGRTLMTIDEGNQQAGIQYKANISVRSLSAGAYFCTLNVNGAKTTTKFVVNK